MITTIGDAIETRLKSLDIFKAVEKTVTAKVLQAPPAVAVLLAYNRGVTTKPTVTRELGWDLLLMISALGAGKGQTASGDIIDAVCDAFVDWRPWTTGGILPAEVPEVRLEGIEQTLLVYTVRLTMKVMPAMIVTN